MLATRTVAVAAVAACSLLVAACSRATAQDDESCGIRQRVELRIVGGDKPEPLASIEVLLTDGYGDSEVKFGPFTTDEKGTVSVVLPPGFYTLHLSSEKEWPYLHVEKLRDGKTRGPAPSLNLSVTDTGAEKWLDGERRADGYEPPAMRGDAPRITYSLLPACELVLRAIDAETGEGLRGAEFFEENAVGEEWAHAIDGDNLGWKAVADEAPSAAAANFTDASGNFKRLVGASGGYAYGVTRPPAGYEAVEPGREVDLDLPYGQERAELVFKFRRAQDEKPPKVGALQDVIYGRAHGTGLLADIAWPEGDGPFPAIISVHGGRWVGSSKTDAGEGAIDVSQWAGFGFFAMSIDYRLAGCSAPPACYQDLLCAIRWVHAHSEEYHVDPERIFLIGMSAGGHLVSLAATLGDGTFPRTGGWDEESSDFRGVISLSAPYELESLSWGSLWAPASEKGIAARRLASPIQHVSDKNKPILILHSDDDGSVPLQQALDFAAALEKAKAPHRISVHKKQGHMRVTEEVIQEARAFIEEASK